MGLLSPKTNWKQPGFSLLLFINCWIVTLSVPCFPPKKELPHILLEEPHPDPMIKDNDRFCSTEIEYCIFALLSTWVFGYGCANIYTVLYMNARYKNKILLLFYILGQSVLFSKFIILLNFNSQNFLFLGPNPFLQQKIIHFS